MSIRVMTWVWAESKATGSDLLVLLAIADQAGDDGGNSHPSIKALAAKARISERSVHRSIKALVELGELSFKQGGSIRGRNNTYRVRMSQSAPVSKDDNLAPANLAPDKMADDNLSGSSPKLGDIQGEVGDTQGQNRVTQVAPHTSLEPSIRTTSTTSRRAAPSDPQFDEFWSVYPRHEVKAKAKVAWAKAVRAVGVEAVLAGARRYAADPNREKEYTKHATTWLNGGCWDDDPLPARSSGGAGRRPQPPRAPSRTAPDGRMFQGD